MIPIKHDLPSDIWETKKYDDNPFCRTLGEKLMILLSNFSDISDRIVLEGDDIDVILKDAKSDSNLYYSYQMGSNDKQKEIVSQVKPGDNISFLFNLPPGYSNSINGTYYYKKEDIDDDVLNQDFSDILMFIDRNAVSRYHVHEMMKVEYCHTDGLIMHGACVFLKSEIKKTVTKEDTTEAINLALLHMSSLGIELDNLEIERMVLDIRNFPLLDVRFFGKFKNKIKT